MQFSNLGAKPLPKSASELHEFSTDYQLTPDVFRNARKSLGHTQHAMAEALRMGKHGWQSISAWETGKTPIPGPVSLAVECLLTHPRSPGP